MSELTELKNIQQSDMIMPGHEGMLDIMQNKLPKVHKDTLNFCKTQSAFMDNMLTVTQMTPMRRDQQCLAEIERAISALRTTHFRQKKQQLKLKRMKEKLVKGKAKNPEMLQIKAEEKETGLEHSKGYISGAIRKVTQLIQQYQSILDKAGIKKFTEEAFEQEKEEYHIKTALTQAICAARSRGGSIDEGNHIYLQQIGLNGATVQRDLNELFKAEQQLLQQGKAPTNEMVLAFLEKAYQGYKGCSECFSQHKGQDGTYRPVALVDQAKKLIKQAKEVEDGS